MKNIKFLVAGFLFFILAVSGAKAEKIELKKSQHKNISQLIERILPGKSSRFVIGDLEPNEGKEIFELSAKNGKINIKGTNDIAIAKGFGWYLSNYCNIHVSWYKNDPIVSVADG